MTNIRHLVRLAALSVVGLAASCGGSDDEKIRAAELGTGCLINSDCKSPLVCAFQRCHTECIESSDCAPGSRCVASDRPHNVCQLDDEVDCSYNSECPEALICAVDGECRDQCRGDSDCVPGQVCSAGACADVDELNTEGQLEAAPTGGGDGVVSRSCEYNTDCPDPEVCSNGFCRLQCKGDRDCEPGETCFENVCVAPAVSTPDAGPSTTPDASTPPPDASTAECVLNSDCASQGANYRCFLGECRPECVADVDCADGESCLNGACSLAAPPGAPPGYGDGCFKHSDCTPGLICGPTRKCVYECLTTFDCAPQFCCSSSFTCVTGSACVDGGFVPVPQEAGTFDGGTCVQDFDCQDGVVCNGYEKCVSGRCQQGRSPCEDDNPCTTDSCDEATGCSHIQIGPQDADGDGHFAAACGGSGDDCDDTNRDISPSAAEVCDGIDNNCNAIVDEGTWQLGPTQTLPAGTEHVYRTGQAIANPPAGAATSDGTIHLVWPGWRVSPPEHFLEYWTLDANLGLASGPTQIWLQPPFHGMGLPRMATNGTNVAIGAIRHKYNLAYDYTSLVAAGTNPAATVPTVMKTAALGNSTQFQNHEHSRADMVWAGTQYVLSWSDESTATQVAYVATMDTAGTVTSAKLAVPSSVGTIPVFGGDLGARVSLAASATHALLMFVDTSNQHHLVRLALPTLSFVGTSTIVVTTDPATFVGDVDMVGGNLVAVATTGSSGGNSAAVRFIDDETGALIDSHVITTAGLTEAGSLEAVGSGYVVALHEGSSIWVGFGGADPATAPEMTTRGLTAAASDPDIVPIDAKNALIVWTENGAAQYAKFSCE